MYINSLKKSWTALGENNPLEAILWPGRKGFKWTVEDFFKTGVEEINATMKYIESLGCGFLRQRALDFGCGVGRLTQPLAHYFGKVDGVDISLPMIELARKYNQYPNQCKYHLNEVNDLSLFSDCSFDFIYSALVLQHMKPEYAKNYVKEFMRLLIPHGLLIFQQPAKLKLPRECLGRRFKRFLRHFMPRWLLSAYYRARGVDTTDSMNDIRGAMEVYGIEKETMMSLLEQHGGHILDIREKVNPKHPGWISFWYAVLKK